MPICATPGRRGGYANDIEHTLPPLNFSAGEGLRSRRHWRPPDRPRSTSRAAAPHGGGIVGTNCEYPSGALFNIQVPDVAAALAAVEAADCTVVMPLQTMDMGLVFACAADPDGSIFGLWTPPAG